MQLIVWNRIYAARKICNEVRVIEGDLRKLFEVTDFYQTVDRDRVFEKLDLAVKVAEKR